MHRHSYLLYVSVALLAATLRACYAWLSYSHNFFPDLFLDSQHYADIAQAIVQGRGTGDSAYVMSPLYPYFLSLFIGADGELATWWVRGIQMSAGVISCVLIAAIAKHVAEHWNSGLLAGWMAGISSAVYGPLIHYETSILVEVMQGFTFILALWMLMVLRAHFTGRTAHIAICLGAGLLLGLAAGFRPIALLIVGISIVVLLLLEWLQKKSLRKIILPCLLLFVGASCAVLPFTIRNYVVAKEFVLLSAYGGMNFWIGNHKEATGLFNTPPDYGFALDPIGVEVARKNTGKELSQKEASQWWSDRAMKDIQEDPLRWITLYGRKVFLFLHHREIPQLGNDFHWFAKKSWPLQFPLNALPLLLLAISLPFTLLLVQRDGLIKILMPYSWLLIYIAGISLFFITGRYRTPIMPLVFVLAAVHGSLLVKQLFSSKKYIVSVVMIITLLFAVMVLTKTFNQSRWLPTSSLVTGLAERQQGMAAFKQKKFIEAEQWYRQSLVIKDNAITRGNLANALKAQGKIDEAEQEYRKALEAAPKDHVAWYNLANLYRDYKQDDAKAVEYYEKSISLNRKFAEPYLNLALLQSRMGNTAAAEKTVENGLQILDNSQHTIREQLVRLKVNLALRKSSAILPAR